MAANAVKKLGFAVLLLKRPLSFSMNVTRLLLMNVTIGFDESDFPCNGHMTIFLSREQSKAKSCYVASRRSEFRILRIFREPESEGEFVEIHLEF